MSAVNSLIRINRFKFMSIHERLFSNRFCSRSRTPRFVMQLTFLSGVFTVQSFWRLEVLSVSVVSFTHPSTRLSFRLDPRGWASLSPCVCTSIWLWCSPSCRQTPAGPPSLWGRRTPPADGGKSQKNKTFKVLIIRSTCTVSHYTVEQKTTLLDVCTVSTALPLEV